MAHEQHPRPRRHPGPYRVHDLLRRLHRQRHRLVDVPRPPLPAHESPRPVKRAVLLVRRQNLVPRLQWQRARNHVQPRRGIRHEHEVICAAVDIVCQSLARRSHEVIEPPAQELHRLAFQLPLPTLVLLQHRSRPCAERSVVQKHHVGPQEKLVS